MSIGSAWSCHPRISQPALLENASHVLKIASDLWLKLVGRESNSRTKGAEGIWPSALAGLGSGSSRHGGKKEQQAGACPAVALLLLPGLSNPQRPPDLRTSLVPV